jgi:hypothetical protein
MITKIKQNKNKNNNFVNRKYKTNNKTKKNGRLTLQKGGHVDIPKNPFIGPFKRVASTVKGFFKPNKTKTVKGTALPSIPQVNHNPESKPNVYANTTNPYTNMSTPTQIYGTAGVRPISSMTVAGSGPGYIPYKPEMHQYSHLLPKKQLLPQSSHLYESTTDNEPIYENPNEVRKLSNGIYNQMNPSTTLKSKQLTVKIEPNQLYNSPTIYNTIPNKKPLSKLANKIKGLFTGTKKAPPVPESPRPKLST